MPFIGDDSVWDAEATCDTADELKRRVLRNLDDWNCLRPLGELVDGDVEVLIAPDCSGEWTQDVQPPDHEGPRQGDGMKSRSWLVNLLCVELARPTAPNQLGSVLESCRPIETLPKGLFEQRAE